MASTYLILYQGWGPKVLYNIFRHSHTNRGKLLCSHRCLDWKRGCWHSETPGPPTAGKCLLQVNNDWDEWSRGSNLQLKEMHAIRINRLYIHEFPHIKVSIHYKKIILQRWEMILFSCCTIRHHLAGWAGHVCVDGGVETRRLAEHHVWIIKLSKAKTIAYTSAPNAPLGEAQQP